MTQFWHERMDEIIRSYEKSIKRFKEEKENPEFQRMAAVSWDVLRDMECYPAKSYFWATLDDHDHIRFYFYKEIPIELFEDFFFELEEAFMHLGYELSCEPTHAYGGDSKYNFVRSHTEPPIKVTISSGVCRQVNTGRMVPETKTECSFLEGV